MGTAPIPRQKSLAEVVFAPSAEEIQGGLGTAPTSHSDEAGLAVECGLADSYNL